MLAQPYIRNALLIVAKKNNTRQVSATVKNLADYILSFL